MTFSSVSPSVYVVFPIILATNDCGLVGNAYTSWTLGVPEHQLSTYQHGFGTSAFNPADLGCPGPDPGKLDDEYELDDEANQGAPSVLLPADLTALDPAWKSCVLGGLDLGRDPPRALRPASNMVPKATSHEPAPVETQSAAFPHSMPKPAGPTPSQSRPPTKTGPSSVPEDSTKLSIEPSQEPPSVCSPVHRSQTQPPTPAESPPSPLAATGIRPRNDDPDLAAAKTTPLPSSVEVYISATSYAGVVGPILAWVSEMQTLASLGGLPPVAPSNPYLALPKHRSAKRSHTSPATQSQSSAEGSTPLPMSDPAAETSLARPSAPSAAYPPAPDAPSTTAPPSSAPLPPSHPPAVVQSAPQAAEHGKYPYEPCGHGDLQPAAIPTSDARSAPSTPSEPASSLASWAATSPSEHSHHPSMKDSTGQSDPTGSSGSAAGPQRIDTVRGSPSRAVAPGISDSGSVAAAAGTTSLSGTRPSSHAAVGRGVPAAGSKDLWVALLGPVVLFSLL